jgi:dihydrofolate reductase
MVILPPSVVGLRVGGVGMIAAMSSNGIIGRSGSLPWRIPEVLSVMLLALHDLSTDHAIACRLRPHLPGQDWAWFKESVKGDVLVHGRRCYEELGRALPGTFGTVVVTRTGHVSSFPDAHVARSLGGMCYSAPYADCMSGLRVNYDACTLTAWSL